MLELSEGIDDVKALRLLPSSDHVNFKVAMPSFGFNQVQTFKPDPGVSSA